jgi:hypothetical protein
MEIEFGDLNKFILESRKEQFFPWNKELKPIIKSLQL